MPTRVFAVIAILTLTAIAVAAQGRTIPEQLAEQGQSLVHGVGVGSGTMGDPKSDAYLRRYDSFVLGDTQRVLRGRVGKPAAAYLSDDQMEVYTDYPVEPAVILYDADAAQSHQPTPLPRATVTLLGGTITINGLTFKSDHESLQRLEPGTECLLLLKHVANRYFIAGQYDGAFAIREGGLIPLHKRAWAVPPAYTDAPAERAIARIVAGLRERK